MRTGRIFYILTLFIIAGIFLLNIDAFAQQAKKQLSAKIATLKQEVSTHIAPEQGQEKTAETLIERLTELEADVQSGYLNTNLHRLQQLDRNAKALQFMLANKEIENRGWDVFEKEWQEWDSKLAEKEKVYHATKSVRMNAATMAIAEAAYQQVRPYYNSSRLYGMNTKISSGLFYLGVAKAQLDFSIFCKSLDIGSNTRPPQLRSVKPELQQLESDVIEALHESGDAGRFATVNSIFKEAKELDAAQMFFGALYKCLQARVNLALLDIAAPDAARLQKLKMQCRSQGDRLHSKAVDHSIGLIYWERTQQIFNLLDAGKAVQEDDPKLLAAIIDHGVPSYLKYFKEGK